MSTVKERAQNLAEEHESGELVVLPTVWDVWSARIAVNAGFKGLTIGSHPVADALGAGDGEGMDIDDYLAVVKRIVDAVDVPVSADMESGYGLPAGEVINRLLDVGAVGTNIEDTVHSEKGRVRERNEHADYIAASRQAADEAGIPFVINGRTDAVRKGKAVFEDPVGEAVERLKLMEQAGARSVYPVGLSTADEVKTLADSVSVPLNVGAHPVDIHGAGDVNVLKDLGARRISFGPRWQAWLLDESVKRLDEWATYL